MENMSSSQHRKVASNKMSDSITHLTLQKPIVTLRAARFNIQEFYVLPTQCIYVFCVDLRTNSDYFPIQH